MHKLFSLGICIILILTITTFGISESISKKDGKNNPELSSGGWIRTYGGDGKDCFKDLILASDGSYIVTGETEIDGTRDAWVLKVDTNGSVLWETTFGTSEGWDGLWPVIETSDGGYLVGGWMFNETQKKNMLVIKIDLDGKINWTFTYEDNGNDEVYSLVEVNDGYLGTGLTTNETLNKIDGYVIKLDFDGNLVWLKNLGKPGFFGELDKIIPANDGGFILVGGYYKTLMSPQARIMKIDEDGNVLWDKSYGALFKWEWFTSITPTSDNSYIAVGGCKGGTYGLGIKGSDVWILKMDNSGSIIWFRVYGSLFLKDYSLCVQETTDGGYIFTGHVYGIGNIGDPTFADWSKMWLVKTNARGWMEWQKFMPGDGHLRTVREIDGGYILCGYPGHGHGATAEHAVIIKTDKNGDII